MRRVVIAGCSMTRVGEHWDKPLRLLMAEPALQLLESLNWPEVDKVYVACALPESFSQQIHLGPLAVDQLSISGIPSLRIEAACASGGVAVHEAFISIKSGLYDSVLVIGVEKTTELTSQRVTRSLSHLLDHDYEAIHGLTLPGFYALLMRRYMHHYKVPLEAFGEFAIQMHKNAVENPLAQLRFPISMERYLNAPIVADPIRLYDCSPAGDGAAALLITSLERGKSISDELIEIAGSAVVTDSLSLSDRVISIGFTSTRMAAEIALKMAGEMRRSVDLLEVHDVFTVAGLISLEDLGYARKGEAGKLTLEEVISRDGDLPVNPEGGLKARGNPIGATGVYQIAEAVQQLLGKAGKLQLENPRLALTQNLGGSGATAAIHLLRQM